MPVYTGKITLDKLSVSIANKPEFQKFKTGSQQVTQQKVPQEGTGAQEKKEIKVAGLCF